MKELYILVWVEKGISQGILVGAGHIAHIPLSVDQTTG